MRDSNSLEVDPAERVKNKINRKRKSQHEVDLAERVKNKINRKRKRQQRHMKRLIAKRLRTDINAGASTEKEGASTEGASTEEASTEGASTEGASTEKEMSSIWMAGLDGAGKTTILNKLGEVKLTPIPGYHMETLEYNNIILKTSDVSDKLETCLQGSHFKDTKGLIFVVDSTDRNRVDRAREELHSLLNEELLKDVVLLVFATKQDMPNPMNEDEITESLGLSSPIPQLHCRVQITCHTNDERLHQGLDWLSQKIKYNCATTGEGVIKGLNLLSNMRENKKYFYRKYNDLPTGYFYQPTDEELIDFLVRLIAEKDINTDIVNRVNLFRDHPAVIIKSHYLHHYMLDTCKYYLFYCEVPRDAKYSTKGHHHFQDRAKGVWQATRKSSIFKCNLLDNTTRYGERQRFRYKPVDETTSSWRMVMYGLPNFPHQQGFPDPQSNMVILKVYENADSKNAMEVKSLANFERDELEKSNTWSAHCAKVQLLEAALTEEKMKQHSCWRGLGATTHLFIEKAENYNRDEHKEAEKIMKRRTTKGLYKAILKNRSTHTRD